MLYKCGSCKKSWTRKESYNKHFEAQYVNSGSSRTGKLIINQCYNAESRSLKLVDPKNKNQPTLTSLLGKRNFPKDGDGDKGHKADDDAEPKIKEQILQHTIPVNLHPDSQEENSNMIMASGEIV